MHVALASSPHEHTRRLRARRDLNLKGLLAAAVVIGVFAADVARAASLNVDESKNLDVVLTVVAEKAPTFQVYKSAIGSDGVVYVVELPGTGLGSAALSTSGPGVLLHDARVEPGRKGAADRVVLTFADDVDFDASADKGRLAVAFHHAGDRAALMASHEARKARLAAVQKNALEAKRAEALTREHDELVALARVQKDAEEKETQKKLAALAEEEAKQLQALEAAKQAEQKAKEAEARRAAELLAAKQAEEARIAKEVEEKRKAEELRVARELEEKKKAEAARLAAEVEAKKKAEAAKVAAALEAKKKAEEARIAAELEAKKKAEAETLAKAEAEKKAAEEAKKKAEEEARLKALDAERRKAFELEQKQKAEEEAKKKAEEARLAEIAAKKKAAEDAVRAEQERLAKEKQAKLDAEKKAEEERVAKEKAAAAKRAEDERLAAIEREKQAKLRAEAEARAAEERRLAEERQRAESARLAAEAEARRVALERRRLLEEQQRNEERRQQEIKKKEQERALALARARGDDAGFGGRSIELSRPNRYARYTPPRDDDGFGGDDDGRGFGVNEEGDDEVDESAGRSVLSSVTVQRTGSGARVGVVVDGGARYQVTRRGRSEVILTLFDTRARTLDVRRTLDARSLGTSVLRVLPSVDEGDRFRVQLIIETRGPTPVQIDQDGKTLWLELAGS